MKGAHKLFAILFVLLLNISLVNAAVVFGGKVYSGDAFSANIGGKFAVMGLESVKVYNNETSSNELYYKKIYIRSDVDEAITVRNGSCESTKMYKYCYRESVINYDDPRTYESDGLRGAMSITVESLPNPITIVTFSRDTVINTYCGVNIPMSVFISNTGEITTRFNYSEYLPINTFVVNTEKGSVADNVITFSDYLLKNSSKNYTYTLANIDCEPKTFNSKYSFTTFNDTLYKNISNINILVYPSHNFNHSLSENRTNNLKKEITYTWNITNIHPSLSLNAKSLIILPKGLFVTQMSPDIVYANGTYYYSGILSPGFEAREFLKFYAEEYGKYPILNKGVIRVSDHDVAYYSNETLQVIPSNVSVIIDVNTSVIDSLSVLVWVKNYDLKEKYYYIYGIIKGIGNEEPLYANAIEPDNKTLLMTAHYNTTDITGNITIIFDGVYRDKDSVEHKLYSAKLITPKGEVIVIATSADDDGIIVENITETDVAVPPVDTSTPAQPVDTTTPVTDTTDKTSIVKEKDFLTRIIEGLNNLLQSIFG